VTTHLDVTGAQVEIAAQMIRGCLDVPLDELAGESRVSPDPYAVTR
jgi:hypothetical protein